ncbi:MAG: contractile injection system tape measure protein [Motiliproteus sp.]
MSSHQVARVRYRLRCETAPDNGVQHHWQQQFESRYAPLIGQALDAYLQVQVDPNVTLQIDHLQLDLGVLSAPWDDDALLQRLNRQITAQLDAQAQVRDPYGWRMSCYLKFLQTGRWPTGTPLQNADQAAEWLQATPSALPELVAQLSQQIATLPMWQRLALQHSPSFLRWLAETVASQHRRAEPGLFLDDFRLSAAQQWVIRLWLICVPDDGTKLPKPGGADQLSAVLSALLTALSSGPADQQPQRWDPADGRMAAVHQPSPLDNDPPITNADQRTAGSALVSAAGVVLLYPFMEPLFRHCGWLEGDQFSSPQARLAALFALHYAASGMREADEGELTLAKWLVNWPVDQPLPRASPLETGHYAEIDDCLLALIAHWTALKNTSIDGLREAFLQRAGSVQPLDEGIRLSVESKTIDILLTKLPWSFAVVRLPWQPLILFVEWG